MSDSADCILKLSGLLSSDEVDGNEQHSFSSNLALSLAISPDRISVCEVNDNEVVFIIFPTDEERENKGDSNDSNFNDFNDGDGEHFSQKLNILIRDKATGGWLSDDAFCSVVDVEEEEEEFIDEEMAMEMWRTDKDRTSHLASFPSPDGDLFVPSHGDGAIGTTSPLPTPTLIHLKRDPLLLDFDNTIRVDVSNLADVDWSEVRNIKILTSTGLFKKLTTHAMLIHVLILI